MRVKTLFVVVALSVFGVAGCNTVEGLGEDVSATGAVISDTAVDVQTDLN